MPDEIVHRITNGRLVLKVVRVKMAWLSKTNALVQIDCACQHIGNEVNIH
jgi:hypothetical protein